MFAIHQDGDLDLAGEDLEQGLEGVENGPAGIGHIVDDDDGFLVEGRQIGRASCRERV